MFLAAVSNWLKLTEIQYFLSLSPLSTESVFGTVPHSSTPSKKKKRSGGWLVGFGSNIKKQLGWKWKQLQWEL